MRSKKAKLEFLKSPAMAYFFKGREKKLEKLKAEYVQNISKKKTPEKVK